VFDLYLITDGSRPEDIERAVREALQDVPAGRVAVQLRAKQLASRALFELARALRSLTREAGVALFINDRVDVALLVQADGVHLPEQGLPIAAARKLLGAAAQIGVSCHDAFGLARATEQGASFATLSPVFETRDKGPALGVERFAELVAGTQLPVFALGGVRPEHAAALAGCGASGLAAISVVFGAADRATATAECLEAWDCAVRARSKA
jgi:thiamine-phosphate pyrophosphorylase